MRGLRLDRDTLTVPARRLRLAVPVKFKAAFMVVLTPSG